MKQDFCKKVVIVFLHNNFNSYLLQMMDGTKLMRIQQIVIGVVLGTVIVLNLQQSQIRMITLYHHHLI